MPRYRLLVATRLLLPLILSTGSHVAAQDDVGRRIDTFVHEEMQRQHVPGVAIAVVSHGAVVKAQGYGLANLEHQVPVSEATMFQSGSLGKQFTATAVMLQVEAGKLSLSDPLTKFFPDAPEGWRAITVRHLLTHTSGIPDYTDGQVDLQKDHTEDQLAHIAFGLPLQFRPGSRWHYSNTGYVLLGVIVHKVSGSFYGDVLAARVFKPLGMTTARIISEADIVANRAAGYRLDQGEVKNQVWVAPLMNTTADGSLYLSIRDLIAWDAGVRAHAILAPDSWKAILEPVQLTSGKHYPYGFGWAIGERGGAPLHQHSGSWQGFKSQFSRFIGDDLSIIVLANLAEARPARFADGVAAIMDPALAVPPLRPIEDREPSMTARCSRLLEQARNGTLVSSEFALLPAGVFAEVARDLQERLRSLGPATKMALLQRVEEGDDRLFTYEVTFGDRAFRFTVGLTPDNRVSEINLTPQ